MITSILDHKASETPERLRMLRLRQVCEATGLCRASIYKLESERRFPSRIRLSGRAVADNSTPSACDRCALHVV